MTAFVIVYGKDPSDCFAAYRSQTREAAWLASVRLVPGVPPGSSAGGCGYVIENVGDVTFSGPLLVGVYNALAGTVAMGAVKKFENRAVGVKRLLALLEKCQARVPANFESEGVVMAKSETKNGVAAARKKTAGVGRPHNAKKFSALRPDSMRANILLAMLAGHKTIPAIAKAAKVPEDRVVPHLDATSRDKGIGYSVTEVNGVMQYEVLLPPNANKDNVIGAPVEKAKSKAAPAPEKQNPAQAI